jgi:hypothetical protein
MDSKGTIATGLVGAAHLLDYQVPQPMVAMVPVASSTVATVERWYLSATTDEAIPPAPQR